MDERLKHIAANLISKWKSLNKKIKTLVIAGVSALAVLAVVLYLVFNTITYDTLYSGLSDSESGQIVTQLKSMGVAYKTSGTTIYVDKNKADEVRMELAMDGYPQSNLDYSTYESATSWAQTDSDKQRYALYQTQNRLQDTIKTIPGVKSVQVTIGQSDSNDYVLSTDKVPVTASVKLNLNTGISLTQKQVKGIVQLVSHSYPDLSADNVTVLDSDGTPLTSSDNSYNDVGDELQLQTQIEEMIRSKVLEVLKPVYGSSNVQVAAGATLDFSEKTTNSTTYSGSDNGKGIVSSEQTSSSATTTGQNTASGTAGVNGGTPTYPSSSSGTSTGTTQSSQQTNYLVNSVNEVVKSHGGTVSKLTVAVLLNSKNQIAATAQAANIKETVAFAVGIDPNNISVQLTPFASQQSNSATQTGSTPFNQMILIAAGAGLLLIIAISILITMLISRKSRKTALLAAAAPQGGAAAPTGPAKPGQVRAQPPAAPELPSLEESLENSEQSGYKRQIEEFVDKKPEVVAQILKNWLKD